MMLFICCFASASLLKVGYDNVRINALAINHFIKVEGIILAVPVAKDHIIALRQALGAKICC